VLTARWMDSAAFLDRLARVILPVGLGAALYLTLAHVFGIEEFAEFRNALTRRIRK